jgi:hypothetical protein
MSDWIGLGIIVLLIICAVVGLSLLGKPYEVTQEEFDKRAHEAPGMLSAGVMGLQKILEPAVEKAAIAQEDFKQGHLDGEQESGEGDNDEGEEGKKANG